jgi:dTDP-4-dehydrorhamnose reductase
MSNPIKVAPLNAYGRSKAEAERRVLDSDPQALVVRTSAFFGPWDEHNFVTQALAALGEGRPFAAAGDMTVSPTYVPDLVNACLDLLIDKECGIWHLTNGAGHELGRAGPARLRRRRRRPGRPGRASGQRTRAWRPRVPCTVR